MRALRIAALVIASAVVGALIAVAVLRGGAKDADEEKSKETAAAERVTSDNGTTIVTVDAATATRSHIAVAALAPGKRSDETNSYATALDVRDLVDARNQQATAHAQAEQARARLGAADAELARLRTLNADNHNISDRVLQEAEANERTERANVDAAGAGAHAAESGVQQRWGAAVAAAFNANAPWIEDLIANRKVLVQVAASQQPPRVVTLETPDGNVDATFVSPAARSDPHIQGRSWYYLAPAGTIVPGMSMTASLGRPAAQNGAIVPHDAVVWTGGKSWIYVERAPNQFARTAIDASTPMDDGYFVTSPPPGTRVVTSGAQQLISEEAKPKVEE